MSLFRESIQYHLTPSPIDQQARATFPGMAHFAGSGPPLKTCRECEFWNDVSKFDYHARKGMRGGQIKPHSCVKYRNLTGCVGQRVPDEASACKYFEESSNPPSRFHK